MQKHLETPCPLCGRLVGDHTYREGEACFAGAGYVLPFEDVPDGPIWSNQGVVSTEVTIAAAFAETVIGKVPVLQFRFFVIDKQSEERVSLPPISLVMEPPKLRTLVPLISKAVNASIAGAAR